MNDEERQDMIKHWISPEELQKQYNRAFDGAVLIPEGVGIRVGGQMEDKWKHRSQNMQCETCMWWVRKMKLSSSSQGNTPTRLGRCRRHAPTMNGYPAVFDEDWCGDHKLNEESYGPPMTDHAVQDQTV